MKETVIIVEGAQGAGKTTVTDFLRYKVPYTNLYRLGGPRDNSKNGLQKSKQMYTDLLNYMKTLENKGVNLVFDRTFFTEEAYSRLGYKEFNFTETYNELLAKLNSLDFEIYFVVLYLENEELFMERINRKGKADIKYAKFTSENSINQQKVYLKMADEIDGKYDNINVLKLKNDMPNMATDALTEIFKDLM